ncbi:MAG: RimK family protein [Legionellales bacterium]|nr:RimK family protein [Legionellales bacterium]
MKTILVTDKPDFWEFARDFTEIVEAQDYLTNEKYIKHRTLRVINLCKSYRYQSLGYYVSLLAQARGHKIIPSALSIQDLKSNSLSTALFDTIIDDAQHSLAKIKSDEFHLSIYFGKNLAKHYEHLCRQLHYLFPAPLIRVVFVRRKLWVMKKVSIITINDVPENHREFLQEAAKDYFSKKRFHSPNKKNTVFDLALLINREEQNPPSDKGAIQKFVRAGEHLGIHVDIIEHDDYRYIGEYDGLFIRETTAVNHHTYRFARRAAADGLVVIDDPQSILKCANKVYLAELLAKHKIRTPKTIILHKHNWQTIIQEIGFPCILKLPAGAFSLGVTKAESFEEYSVYVKEFFATSDLIIAQAYMPTAFDWRIGIFDNKPIFACRYYMAKDHWQIYNWKDEKETMGDFDAVSVFEAPKNVINTALRASKAIGDGLYGVDLKEMNKEVYVIEVNDNPNIDANIEDSVSGDELYTVIMNGFLNRMRKAKGYL